MQRHSSNNRGFVLIACLIITLIVSLGSIALINRSSLHISGSTSIYYQEILRNEAISILNKVYKNLQTSEQLGDAAAATDDPANNSCNTLPTAIQRMVACNNAINYAYEGSELEGGANSDELNKVRTQFNAINKSINLTYLKPVPARGTNGEDHHLYRIDVTLTLNDWSVTQSKLVVLDRYGAA